MGQSHRKNRKGEGDSAEASAWAFTVRGIELIGINGEGGTARYDPARFSTVSLGSERRSEMSADDEYLRIAKDAFREIQSRFPAVQMVEDPAAPVELSVEIPVQLGVIYPVNLNLQNRDELHFSVGHFWLEWFPCSNDERVDEFVDAVSGFLAGRYRILEHFRGRMCVKAELQREESVGQWSTFGTSVHCSLPLPWRKQYRVLINRPLVEQNRGKPNEGFEPTA
jgi:hypothetical protein